MVRVCHSSCWRDIWLALIVGQLDVFLGYAGVHTFRKLRLGYFRASNASEVLKNAKLVYQNITKGGLSVLRGELALTWWAGKKVKEIKVDHRKHDSNCKNMYA